MDHQDRRRRLPFAGPVARVAQRLALLAVLAPLASAQHDAVATVLGRHAAALGGAAALENSGDIEMLGRVESGGRTQRFRLLLRLQPPAMREELTALDSPDSPPLVFVSSAHRAWQLGGTAELRPGTTVAILEGMHELRLMLRPLPFVHGVSLDPGNPTLPAVAGWPPPGATPPAGLEAGRPVATLLMASPASLRWQAHFDRETGRLIGLDQPHTYTRPWVRLSEWRKFGDLWFPTLRIQGSEALPCGTMVVEDVRTGLSLPDELFAGDPFTPRTAPADVAPLSVVPAEIPGTGYVVLKDVRANGRPTTAIFDTAADGLFLRPEFTSALGLGMLASQRSLTLFGTADTTLHFVARLELGSERLFQIPATSVRVPMLSSLLDSQQPQIVLGGWPIMQLNPVLDLGAGRLVSRGRHGVRLVDLAPLPAAAADGAPPGRTVFEIPLGGDADERGVHIVSLDVSSSTGSAHVLLDTGIPGFLRLSASGLRRLGLPTTREPWLELGAVALPMSGAAGGEGSDLLVRPAEIGVGPVVYRRPWVALAGLGDSPEAHDFPWDGLLGAAALLPFARVGFDADRGILELEVAASGDAGRVLATPGYPAVQLIEEGRRAVVAEAGRFLGFLCAPPTEGARDGPEALPRVTDVLTGSPAAGAGIRPGDRLAAIDGASVATQAVSVFVARLWVAPGQRVVLRFLRQGAAGEAATGGGEVVEVVLP